MITPEQWRWFGLYLRAAAKVERLAEELRVRRCKRRPDTWPLSEIARKEVLRKVRHE